MHVNYKIICKIRFKLASQEENYAMFFAHIRFRDKLGVKVIKALKRNDDGVTHAAIDMLCALMQVRARNLGNCEEQLPLTDCRSTVGRLLADTRPNVGRQVLAMLSANSRPTNGRLSVMCR